MKIAADGRITKNQQVAFEALIADGTIHPDLERRQAAEMIDSYFSSLPKRGTR
jgi:hypothetical protein